MAEDNSDGRFKAALDDAVDTLSKFVIPLYVEDSKKRPVQVGSGFFVRRGERKFLISAAHVLRNASSTQHFYYIKPDVVCKLSGTLIIGQTPPGVEDITDVAGMMLSEHAESPSPEIDKFVVDDSYLKPQYLPRSEREYVIIGFPASRSSVDPARRAVTARAYAYHAASIAERQYADLGVSPTTHIAIPLDLKEGYDSEGFHRNFPKPKGMSGSPIWVLYEEPDQATHRTFPLVGIGTRYIRKSKVLIGTDSRVIGEIMNAAI